MKRLFAIALLLAGAAVRAQNAPTVTARIEPDSIMIGDRFDLTVEVDKDLVQVVQFPEFENKEGSPLELVKNHPIDTLERDGRHLRLRKRYTLAAFEEGKWNLGLPAVLYADKNIVDTLRARDSLYLEVATFQIDSTSQSIYDLKPQRNLPFRFAEVSGYAKWGVLALLMILVALYALKRILARYGKGLGDLFKPAPPQPPHVVAIKALEALHNQKLWQNNRHKQYYSGLTDILRTYIAARWGVGAMEMTSDEIIEAMRSEELPDKARMDLTAILRDADLVKFAKATPDGEQNEADYLKAFYFVEETKLVVEEEEPEQPDPMQNKMYRLLYIVFLFAALGASAQDMPERSEVRRGNRQYNKGNYEKSIERYERALEAAPESFEARYNLGNALYKAERFDKAEQTMRQAAADTLRTDDERAQAFYNLGNAQFKQQKYKEALESYKQSLRLNPSDQEAKYNYAYTKRLIDDDENGGGGGGDDKNQDKDQNKEQQQGGQDQQNGDQQKDDQQKDDKGQGDDKEQQGDPQQNPAQPDKEQEGDPQGEPQPVPAGISPQEQEQMLDAIQAQEDRTQDKLKEKQGVVVRGSKNW